MPTKKTPVSSQPGKLRKSAGMTEAPRSAFNLALIAATLASNSRYRGPASELVDSDDQDPLFKSCLARAHWLLDKAQHGFGDVHAHQFFLPSDRPTFAEMAKRFHSAGVKGLKSRNTVQKLVSLLFNDLEKYYQGRIRHLEGMLQVSPNDAENYAAHLEADRQELENLKSLEDQIPGPGGQPMKIFCAYDLFLLCAKLKIQDTRLRFSIGQVSNFDSPWLHPAGRLLHEMDRSRVWPSHQENLIKPTVVVTPPTGMESPRNQAKLKGKKSLKPKADADDKQPGPASGPPKQ
jgi:hypothetical protein